jgi:hypothetical protein
MDDEEEQRTGAADELSEETMMITRSEAFRETFAFRFNREEAQIVRRFGDLLEEVLGRAVYQERNPGSSYTLQELFAVAADLRFLEGFLYGVGSERRLSDLSLTDQSLSQLAERFAPEVAALAERLEQEIQQLISDEEEKPEAILEQKGISPSEEYR